MLFGSEQTRSTASAWAQASDDAKPDAAVSTTHISARNGNPLGLQRMTCYGISWLFTDQHRGCDNPCSAGICNTPWSGKVAEHFPDANSFLLHRVQMPRKNTPIRAALEICIEPFPVVLHHLTAIERRHALLETAVHDGGMKV